MKSPIWFRENIEPHLLGYEIEYKSFPQGDFGNLEQVAFNSDKNGGEIDFWSSGCLGMHFVDYVLGAELLNVFLLPHQDQEKDKAWETLQALLKI